MTRRSPARLDGERLAGLVNNAGVGYKGPLLHQPWEKLNAVNLLGPIRVTRDICCMFERWQARA